MDTDEGMDEETLQRAMDPFFTTKGTGGGTGLGLSATHGIIEQLQGRLILKSRRGKRTTAQLWIPVAQPPVEEIAVPQTEQRRGTSQADGEPLKVLAVDDDALVLMNMAAMLEDLGHIAIEAASAERALEVLDQDRQVDLVITDQAMPGMTGLELVGIVRREHPELPVILATGYAELPSGPDENVPRLDKPFFEQDLTRAIAELRGTRHD